MDERPPPTRTTPAFALAAGAPVLALRAASSCERPRAWSCGSWCGRLGDRSASPRPAAGSAAAHDPRPRRRGRRCAAAPRCPGRGARLLVPAAALPAAGACCCPLLEAGRPSAGGAVGGRPLARGPVGAPRRARARAGGALAAAAGGTRRRRARGAARGARAPGRGPRGPLAAAAALARGAIVRRWVTRPTPTTHRHHQISSTATGVQPRSPSSIRLCRGRGRAAWASATFTMLTRVTLTPKSSSIAWRTCVVRVRVHAERVAAGARALVALLRHGRATRPSTRPSPDEGQRRLRDRAAATVPHTTAPILSSEWRYHCNTLEVAERLRYRFILGGAHDDEGRRSSTRQRGRRRASSRARRRTLHRQRRGAPPVRAERRPERRAASLARFTFWTNVRGVFANAWPPPVNCAARLVPARAPSVPFPRHGSGAAAREGHGSSSRASPREDAFCSRPSRARGALQLGRRRPGLLELHVASPVPPPPSPGPGALSGPSPSGPHLHDPVLRARGRRPSRAGGCSRRRRRAGGGPSCVTRFPARTPRLVIDPLEDARRRGRRADRARLADVVRPVRPRAGKLKSCWRLIVPWKPFPIPVPGH